MDDNLAVLKSVMVEWLKAEANLNPHVCPIIARNLLTAEIYDIEEIAHYFKRNDTKGIDKVTSVIDSSFYLEAIVRTMLRLGLLSEDCESIQAYLPRK